MKLISLKLCNFRQFYGRTPEIFLASGESNTTVIHGNNGAGKTSLLNAFTWVMYEQFTAAFAASEQLVNKRALGETPVGGSVECAVEIIFEHRSKSYQLKRRCYGRKLEQGVDYTPTQLFMLVAGDDGRWLPPMQQPEDIIGQILPESLHRYFFFDGERIDHLLRDEKRGEIAEATKVLLGIRILERGMEHLKKARRTLEGELRAIGDLEVQTILLAKNRLEEERDRATLRHQEITQELAQQSELKTTLSTRLMELGGAKELQNLKNELEAKAKSLRDHLIQAKQAIQQSISTQGYAIFLSDTVATFNGIIQNLRQTGELPAGIKQRFVQELLARQRCICGTELLPGSPSYQQVAEWREKAGIANIEENAIRLEAKVREMDAQNTKFWQSIDQAQEKISQSRTELAQVENRLDEIKQKLRTYPDFDIQNLQKKLDTTEAAIRSLTLEQGANQQERTRLADEIVTQDKQLAKQQLKENQQNLAQRRIQATQASIEQIAAIKQQIEQQFRQGLETKVQEIFTSISFTPYLPQLNERYELSLIETTGGIATNVAASTGENQILSLSFIGGIIDRVREWSQQNTLIGHDSSTFPIIMDSPFGSLDEIYRRHVANVIPSLANQLVVLVTKTQWRGEVAEEMQRYIGKEYVLVYHSPKPDCTEDEIEINGVFYPLVKFSKSEFEYTELVEVS
jgi:DNA sulfur modification protein DndD